MKNEKQTKLFDGLEALERGSWYRLSSDHIADKPQEFFDQAGGIGIVPRCNTFWIDEEGLVHGAEAAMSLIKAIAKNYPELYYMVSNGDDTLEGGNSQFRFEWFCFESNIAGDTVSLTLEGAILEGYIRIVEAMTDHQLLNPIEVTSQVVKPDYQEEQQGEDSMIFSS